MSLLFGFNRLFGNSRKNVQPQRVRYRVMRSEKLDDRLPLAADFYIHADRLPADVVLPGETAIGAQFSLVGMRNTPVQVVFAANRGMLKTADVFELYADAYDENDNPGSDGDFETLIDQGGYGPNGNMVFDLNGWGRLLAREGIPLQVQEHIDPTATDTELRLGKPWIGFRKGEVRPNVFYVGAKANPIITVDGPTNIDFTIDSTSANTVPGMHNVSLGTLNIDTSDGAAVTATTLSFSIDVLAPGGTVQSTTVAGADVLHNVELFNPATNQVVSAMPVIDYDEGYGFYFVDGVVLQDNSAWEIRVDVWSDAEAGIGLRANVVADDMAPVFVPGYGNTFAFVFEGNTGGRPIGDVNGGLLTGEVTRIVQPFVVSNANPDADGTNVPTGISPFGQFRFTAGIDGSELLQIPMLVNATNVTIDADAFLFYDKADATSVIHAYATDSVGNVLHGDITGTFYVYADITGIPFSGDFTSGQSRTFSLSGNVKNSMIDSTKASSLDATLLQDEVFWKNADSFFFGLGLASDIVSTKYRS